jgi:hypothetical protein
MTTAELIANLCAAAREDGAKDTDPVTLRLCDVEELCRTHATPPPVQAVKLETVFDKEHNLVRPACYRPDA